jgi:hypothetical protein
MKILLIYPQCPNSFWGFKHALKFISKKGSSATTWINNRVGYVTFDMAKKTG